MSLFKSNGGRPPVRVTNTLPLAEPDVTVELARMALAVSIIDETLLGDRTDARRLTNALLEVRHALCPSTRPLDPVPAVPRRTS